MLALAILLLVADAGQAASTATGETVAPTVSARIDRQTARVGDLVALTLVAIRKKGVVTNLAAPQLGKFLMLDRSEVDKDLEDGSAQKEWTLHIAAYEPGTLEIPPIVITYLTRKGEVREVRTARLEVTIEAITTDKDVELREIAPPVRVISENRTPLYIVGAWLALGAAFGLGWLIRGRLRRRREAAIVAPPLPPSAIALERLEALVKATDLTQLERKAFFLGMSEILRDYLRARFGVLALTTSELGGELEKREELSPGARLAVMGWLEACDLVKFAQYPATQEEALSARGELEHIIAELAPSAVEAPSEREAA